MGTLKYIKHIDGFRALAVSAIVFFHLGFSQFSGGFVGVDIFFVISGYLLTRIIHVDIQAGSFSLAQFYEKRVRRIIPALYLLIIVTSILVVTFFLPRETIEYFKSLISSLLNISNFYFYSESGYFNAISVNKPLLHTWSLSIEEQFYFILPCTLIILNRLKVRSQKILMVVVFLTSLIFSLVHGLDDTPSTFYLLPYRLWEFLLGSILALKIIPTIKSKITNNFISVLGMILISFSIYSYDETTYFPGWAVITPTLGTFLLIYSNLSVPTILGDFFGLGLFRFIGKVSYSLYLWHWVLLVFYREVINNKLTLSDRLIILVITFLISVLSWYFIEEPIRNKKILKTSKKLFMTIFYSTIFIIILSLYIIKGDVFSIRYGPAYLKIEKARQEWNPLALKCFGWDEETVQNLISKFQKLEFCTSEKLKNNSDEKKMLVWGDSHSSAAFSTFQKLAKTNNATLYHAGYVGCPPLLGLSLDYNQVVKKCELFNSLVFDNLVRLGIKNVFLIAKWGAYHRGDVKGVVRKILTPYIDHTIEQLLRKGIHVWIVKQAPEYDQDIGRLIYSLLEEDNDGLTLDLKKINYYGTLRSKHFEREKDINNSFSKHFWRVKFLDFNKFFCPQEKEKCYLMRDGVFLYKDSDHISNGAANALGDFFKDEIKLKPNDNSFGK